MSKMLLILILVLCLYSVTQLKNSNLMAIAASTLIVPDEYPTIQEAINKANPGDLILVRNGVYQENIIIKKSITLIGEDREKTIINGGGSENVITIMASKVTISRFTIKNSSHLTGSGIYVGYFGNVVNNNVIVNNNIGIKLEYSSGNRICGNEISSNNIGVYMFSASGNEIYQNTFVNNYIGINIYFNSLDNTIYGNILQQNSNGVRIAYNSNNNVFYFNNFIANTQDVYAEQTTNVWSCNGNGNYWDKYKGRDLDRDGLGDFSYNITEMDKDYYPLMGRSYLFAIPFMGYVHYVVVISNSTITNFAFKNVVETKSVSITFNASCAGFGCTGFSRVVIPKALMPTINTVLINEGEVNITFLDVVDPKNFYLYIEYCDNCSIKIVYSELLHLYNQLLSDNSKLLNELYNLTESLNNVQRDYDKLKEQLQSMNLAYQSLKQNFESLICIAAVITFVFITTTIYMSKQAHERVKYKL